MSAPRDARVTGRASLTTALLMSVPQDAMAAGEQLMQLDQAITLTLQEIDENFARAHQVVTARILPAMRAYEASCSHTWQAARFWKQFFEASAQVSLTQQPLEELENTTTIYEPEQTHSVAHSGAEHLTRDSEEMLSPPRLSTSRYVPHSQGSSIDTPFERLRRDVEASRAEDMTQSHVLPAADLSVANDPSMALSDVPRSSSPLKARRRSSARPRVSVAPGQDGVPSNPFATGDTVRMWNGIADLRRTPLRAERAPRATDDDDEDTSLALPEGMSPPVTMQFSVPPSTYLKTPAREAARRVVDDLLRSVGGADADASAGETSLRPPASATRRKSVVETPLTKRRASTHQRRDSLPTPPTITKVYPAPGESGRTEVTMHSRAGQLLDEGEGFPPELAPSPATKPSTLDEMLSVEDDDEEPEAPAPSAGHSRSIEDDTLFGLGARRTPSAAPPTSPSKRALSSAVRRSSAEMRLLGDY